MEQVCFGKKQKNYFFSELTGKTPTSLVLRFTLPNLEELTSGSHISILTLWIRNRGPPNRRM